MFLVHEERISDTRQPGCLFRIVGVGTDPDQRATGADCMDQPFGSPFTYRRATVTINGDGPELFYDLPRLTAPRLAGLAGFLLR